MPSRPSPTPPVANRSIRLRRSTLAAVVGFSILAGTAFTVARAVDNVGDPNNTNEPLPVGVDESTRRMAILLRQVKAESNPLRNPFRSPERVAALREKLAHTTNVQEHYRIMVDLCDQLLQTGACEDALAINVATEQYLRENNIALNARVLPDLWTNRAVCYLRMGEQENCCANHNADSCLFPIKGEGVHSLPRGSRGAIAILTELLSKYPGDLRGRWLLNVAYSTLGEYPAAVPPKWLIEPKRFASEYDIKRFPDVAAQLGLDIDAHAGGVILDDFDNDGLLDVMVSSWGLSEQLRFFHNDGKGVFTERTKEAKILGEVGGLNMIQTDYNNDGFIDVFIPRGAWLQTEGHYPASLLRNNGDGTFTDVTEQAGLLRMHPTQASVWFDYDGDGFLDLFVGNESTEEDQKPSELYHNNGDGTFTECAESCGVDKVGYIKGVVSADYNNDGRPDLFLSRRDGRPFLLRNDGGKGGLATAWKFSDVTEAAGIEKPGKSFACAFFDYDNDGYPDIFVSGYFIQDVGDVAADYLGLPNAAEKAHLYHNNHDGTFTDVSREVGLNKVLHTMGCNFGDLDNDGWLDLYTGTGDPAFATLIPSRMFRSDGGQRFQDVTTSGGFGQLQKGHGIAFGDINNDGESDIYSVVGGAIDADHYRHQVFANPGHGNKWLKLKLQGVRSNRQAIGARVHIVVETESGPRSIYRTIGSGADFGASPLRLEVGLGAAKKIVQVEIFWPATGLTQTVTGLSTNQSYTIKEGDQTALALNLPSFQWRNPSALLAHQ